MTKFKIEFNSFFSKPNYERDSAVVLFVICMVFVRNTFVNKDSASKLAIAVMLSTRLISLTKFDKLDIVYS